MTRGFLLAAPSSGSGKTTIMLGLLAALNRRYTVQPYKAGPDYIDSAWHTRIVGRPSVNLDTWMSSVSFVKETFLYHARTADIAMVEGVMGLFDGKGGNYEEGSSSHLAKTIQIPVVLVVDAGMSARSVGAVVLGCEQYDPNVSFAGVIVNRIASESHFQTVKESIEAKCKMPVLGYVKKNASFTLPERQLGLISSYEAKISSDWVETLGEAVTEHIDIDRLLEQLPELPASSSPRPITPPSSSVKIAIAKDAAFCFYYEDNLRLLKEAGAELIEFSPLQDKDLPKGIHAIYIGGGFPEEHAKLLSENKSMREAIRTFPNLVWAECGGMMYLCESFLDKNNIVYPMCGRMPRQTKMTGKLAGFGYREVSLTRNSFFGTKKNSMRGHLFHWADFVEKPPFDNAIFATKTDRMGFETPATLACWFHLYLPSNENLASNFIQSLHQFQPTV